MRICRGPRATRRDEDAVHVVGPVRDCGGWHGDRRSGWLPTTVGRNRPVLADDPRAHTVWVMSELMSPNDGGPLTPRGLPGSRPGLQRMLAEAQSGVLLFSL